MADQSTLRITKEIHDIQKSCDLSLGVAFRDVDVKNVKALIIGPHDTPYQFGFFEFAVKFNRDYPRRSPSVMGLTTNGGRCRFNPNIYSSGKVCLSILGTWRGERGEEWSAAQGLESILISIQSLMSSNPYVNEPGYEDANAPTDKENQKEYVQKIRHETIRISVIMRLEEYLGIKTHGGHSHPNGPGNPPNAATNPATTNPILDFEKDDGDADSLGDDCDESTVPFEPFKDLCKQRFLWYYDSYIDAVRSGQKETRPGKAFTKMPFEGTHNIMDGKFNYAELEKRLIVIKAALDQEAQSWAKQGLAAKAKETMVAANLQRQFEQVVESFKKNDMPHSFELVDGNPFVWVMTYFGRPMTNYDGGLFRIRFSFSPRFPDEQPRVLFETKLFHHAISTGGTPCYMPVGNKRDDVRSHIDAIISMLEEEAPPYDPRRLVNLEAHKLYWGSKEDRKTYNRRLRRSVQESAEG